MKYKKILITGILILVSMFSIVLAQFNDQGVNRFQYAEPTFQEFYSGLGVDYTTFWPQSANAETCQPGNDFFVTVVPGGCSPAVVRSDLLEEQNVPVFCKLVAVRTNPIVDVAEIRSVAFSGQYPNEVVGVSYHPSKALLKSYNPSLGTGVFNDIGYIVVLLKQQQSEKTMPNKVDFNLSANIRYDLKSLEGIGKATFFLPVMTDTEWTNSYREYGFWRDNGYIRAEAVDANSARISIYSSQDTVIRNFNLQKGETSSIVYVPGFYCRGGLRIKLDSIGAPKKSVLLQVDEELLWAYEGTKFLDDKCSVERIDKIGVGGQAIVNCEGKRYNLRLGDATKIRINNVEYSLGDKIPEDFYLINYFPKEFQPFVIIAKNIDNSIISEEKVKQESLSKIDSTIKSLLYKSTGTNNDDIKKTLANILKNSPDNDIKILTLDAGEGGYTFNGVRTTEVERIKDESALQRIDEYSGFAENIAEELVGFYPADGDEKGTFGARALIDLAGTFKNLGNQKKAIELYDQVISKYPNTNYARIAESEKSNLIVYDYSNSTVSVTVKRQGHVVSLKKIREPTSEEAGAFFRIRVGDKQEDINLAVGQRVSSDEYFGKGGSLELVDLTQATAKVKYMNSTGNLATRDVKLNEQFFIGSNIVTLTNIKFKEVAGIELLPEFPNELSSINVSVNIGIEKRGIQLSDSKIIDKIKGLNKSIEEYDEIANRLSNWTDVQSKACFAVSTLLLVKNLLQGTGGASMARSQVMTGPGGWNSYCRTHANDPKYGSFENCLRQNSGKIEQDVQAHATRINEINQDIRKAQETAKGDQAAFGNSFIDNSFEPFLEKNKNIQQKFGDKDINEMYKNGSITVEEMKNIMLYGGAENTSSEINLSGQYLNNLFTTINQRTKTQAELAAGAAAGDTSYCSHKYTNPKVKYYDNKQAAVVPLDTAKGWYAATKPILQTTVLGGGAAQSYAASGQVTSYYLANVGPNGIEEFNIEGSDDRPMIYITPQTGMSLGDLGGCFANEAAARDMALKARRALEEASSQYGRQQASITGVGNFAAQAVASVSGAKCTDFMPVSDCQLMFNLCDPILCPSSRCDLGGKYKVQDVIQSGIFGGLILCLPNIKEGIYLPVCLTGIKEGIKAYVSLLKSHRDCLQESLETGRQIGICDEMYSIYMCEFIWRQLGPLLQAGIPRLIEAMMGQNRGGSEYMTVSSSFDNMRKSVSFIQSYYTSEVPRIFRTTSVAEAGTELCKSSVSTNYPIFGDLADTMLNPESPTQFSAWFDEIPFSSVTVPPTSQYKVYYHIYAGEDAGAHYSVYLKSPPETGYYASQPEYPVASGYITIGQSADNSKDFTAPAGYRQLCVRVNQQEECGFGRVSTDFGLNYLNDRFLEEQATERVSSERECIGGSPSFYSLAQPSLGAGAGELLQPEIYNRGIIRVCSTDNPGQTTTPTRWKEVGYCDQARGLKCWLDQDSVRNAIQGIGIENRTLSNAEQISRDMLTEQNLIMTQPSTESELDNLRKGVTEFTKFQGITNLNTLFSTNNLAKIKNLTSMANNVSINGYSNKQRAEGLYIKFLLYEEITKKIISIAAPQIRPTTEAELEEEQVVPETITTPPPSAGTPEVEVTTNHYSLKTESITYLEQDVQVESVYYNNRKTNLFFYDNRVIYNGGISPEIIGLVRSGVIDITKNEAALGTIFGGDALLISVTKEINDKNKNEFFAS